MLAAHAVPSTSTWPRLSMPEADVSAPIDANGNLTADGTRTFEWDARNQLVAVTQGTERKEFSYNGKGQRTSMALRIAGTLTKQSAFIWCEFTVCEERSDTGAVLRRFLQYGIQEGVARFSTHDHLGSTREILDEIGTLLRRYEYDAFGNSVAVTGQADFEPQFTGHFGISNSSLLLAPARAYDPRLARWISEDPIRDGNNFYAYVENSPPNDLDPSGLQGMGRIRRWFWPYRVYKWSRCTWERQVCVDAGWDKCKAKYPSDEAKDVYRCTSCFSEEAKECDRTYFKCLSPL